MKFEFPLLQGRLIRRYKRFLADIEDASGNLLTIHCPNSGSMMGLIQPGNRVFYWDSRNPRRKLRHTWELVEVDGVLVGINTNRPNRLVEEAFHRGLVAEFKEFTQVKREVRYGEHSRLDLLFWNETRRCYAEVKNVTLVEEGVALFPDAVTSRGARHLDELQDAVRKGHCGAIVFVVQRMDAHLLRPAWEIDANFSSRLREVAESGVNIVALQARVSTEGIEIVRRLPFEF